MVSGENRIGENIITNHKKPTFSFVAGRHHGPEAWDYVRGELANRGRESIAPYFPIEEGDASLDDHAAILAQAEKDSGANEFIRVGWSWGANVVPRKIGDTAVSRLIFIAGVFHEDTVKNHKNADGFFRGHTIAYEAMSKIINTSISKSLRRQDYDHISYTFYDDIEDEDLVERTIGGLRLHPRRQNEPVLEEFPDVPISYIATLDDKAVKIDAQRAIAKSLEVQPIEIEGCHAPMLSDSRAKKLAQILINLADGNAASYTPRLRAFPSSEPLSAYR